MAYQYETAPKKEIKFWITDLVARLLVDADLKMRKNRDFSAVVYDTVAFYNF